MYKKNCGPNTTVIPMEQDYYLIKGPENYILTPIKEKICADDLVLKCENITQYYKYYHHLDSSQSPSGIPQLIQRDKYIYVISNNIVYKYKIEKRLVFLEQLDLPPCNTSNKLTRIYRTPSPRFWISSQYILDLDSFKIYDFKHIPNISMTYSCGHRTCNLNFCDGCKIWKFMQIANKFPIFVNSTPSKTIIFDFDTCSQSELRGKCSIVSHHSINEVILVSDDNYQIFRRGLPVATNMSPPTLTESLSGNKIILEYKKNPFETFRGEFEYKPHEYVKHLEMLHDVINDAINNEPEFGLFISEENNKVIVTIRINIKYVYEPLIYELTRAEESEIEILSNKVNLLMTCAGFQ